MLPPELVEDFRPLLDSAAQDGELARLVKDADTLCAYTKCLEEINAGNRSLNQLANASKPCWKRG